ncbi:hypothetical protein [Nucisporomicrobium flavum]|nr:hypothetical protein [Nucisporomicrobium flavum]
MAHPTDAAVPARSQDADGRTDASSWHRLLGSGRTALPGCTRAFT